MTSKYDQQQQLLRIALSLLLLSVNIAIAAAQPRDPLADLKLPNTTIVSVETVAAVTTPGRTLPAYRKVVGVINPTSDSDINFEVWLPVEGWNGKFQGVGNGGFAGNINPAEMRVPLARGYAVAATDTGHKESFMTANWALGHPEKVIDFGYRAIHEMTVKAKAIIQAYYGKAPQRSYFASCSNGGRQALMEAQRYPADYDGIIAGAPANNWTHVMFYGAFIQQIMLKDAASYLPAKKMKALESATLASCDEMDGLADGLIDDPTRCRFDPAVLLCKGTETDDCLTASQIETLKKLYAGVRDAKGNQLVPNLVPGSESGGSGWGSWISGSAPGKGNISLLAMQFLKNMVFENQNWDIKSLNVERDLKFAEQKLAQVLNATNPDLSAFKKRGGKLIVYHGWNDAAIPAGMSINYYKSVIAKMGQRNSDTFLRLYVVPGMHHCQLGPGPNQFGQGSGCAPCDAQHDIITSIEEWVEKGTAPDALIATKFKNEATRKDPVRTRPLCPYPKVARYKGSDSLDDAANYSCVSPK